MTSKDTTLTEKIDKILDNCNIPRTEDMRYDFSMPDTVRTFDTRTPLKQSILSLINSEVRKARIDELDILYHTGGDCETVWYALCDRLSELKENKLK